MTEHDRPRRPRAAQGRMWPGRDMRISVVSIACLLTWACGSPAETVRHIKDATVPAGDRAPVLAGPVREAQSLQFSWEFDSALEPVAYLEWVTARLANRGFTIQQREDASVGMSRVDEGDAYRVRVEVSRGVPTHVRVSLRASPD